MLWLAGEVLFAQGLLEVLDSPDAGEPPALPGCRLALAWILLFGVIGFGLVPLDSF